VDQGLSLEVRSRAGELQTTYCSQEQLWRTYQKDRSQGLYLSKYSCEKTKTARTTTSLSGQMCVPLPHYL